MLLSIFLHPSENRLVVIQLVGDFFKCVTVDFEKCEQMLVESHGFVVITVEQAFAVQPRLVNQTRQMDITAEFLVRTAWMQSSHEARSLLCGRQWPRDSILKTGLCRARRRRLLFREQFSLCQPDLPDGELARKHPAFLHADRPCCHIALQ